jgi:DNA-binding XRE family transcriptional regulator
MNANPQVDSVAIGMNNTKKRKAQPDGGDIPLVWQREKKGMNRVQLARAIGIDYRTLYLIERGAYRPSFDLAMHISGVLQEPISILFPYWRELKPARSGRFRKAVKK